MIGLKIEIDIEGERDRQSEIERAREIETARQIKRANKIQRERKIERVIKREQNRKEAMTHCMYETGAKVQKTGLSKNCLYKSDDYMEEIE